jgi:diguanylate cyclase (GGDEF)-like protein
MKIGGSKPISSVSKYSARIKTSESATAPPRDVADTSSVLGVSSAELTPKVRDALMQLMAEVDSLRRELEQSRARIEYLERLADQDSLAPVANRRAFVRELTRIIAFSARYNTAASVVYFDVNGMKEINDTYGHAAGDATLMRVADVLIENVRESDVVGRLGGDEFAVILSQGDEVATAEKARSLVDAIESRPLDWNDVKIPIRVAFGSYTFRGGDDAGVALAAADRAMYARKQEDKSTSGT